MEEYTTTADGSNIIPDPPFYLLIHYGTQKYYKIVNDPSVTWSYDNPTFPDFLYSTGSSTHKQTNCMMDVFSQLKATDTADYTQLNTDYPFVPDKPLNFNLYGHLDTIPCSPTGTTMSTLDGTTPDTAHILRINFGVILSGQTNQTINITGAGLTAGYVNITIKNN